MPYAIRKSGDKYEVITSASGKVHGTHDTEEEAKKQLAALHANAPPEDEKKGRNDSTGRIEGLIHFDAGELGKAELTPEGFLRVPARIARVGVQEYRNSDGTVRKEYRSAEEVFRPDSLASFSLRPVTDDHPWGESPPLLHPGNASKYQRGAVGEVVRRGGKFVEVPSILITDQGLIDKIRSGVVEVSAGYRADTIEEEGEYEGQKYTHVQRNIVGNHVAIVPRARAGEEVRLKLDSAVPMAIGRICEDPVPPPGPKEPASMSVKTKIDGVEVEFANEQSAQVVERAMKAQAEALTVAETAKAKVVADAVTVAEGVSKARADAAAALATEKARADAAEAKLKEAEKARADATDPKRIAELVQARVALQTRAAEILGPEMKLDGLDERGVKEAVIKKVFPDEKLDGQDAVYVDAMYRAADKSAGRLGLGAARVATAPRLDGTPDNTKADADAARSKMIKDNAERWKGPLSGGKSAA